MLYLEPAVHARERELAAADGDLVARRRRTMENDSTPEMRSTRLDVLMLPVVPNQQQHPFLGLAGVVAVDCR